METTANEIITLLHFKNRSCVDHKNIKLAQPLSIHSERLLKALIESGHKYFVRQTYKRGINPFEENQKGAFLISHYNDLNKANIHYEALTHDGNRFLYDISNIEHLDKLNKASRQPEGYKIYTPMLQQEWKPTEQVAIKIRKYIDYKLKWRPGRNDNIGTNLFSQFGELFLTLKYRIHEVSYTYDWKFRTSPHKWMEKQSSLSYTIEK